MKLTMTFLAAILLAPLAVLHAADTPRTPPRIPNIVVILADDMPWNYPGFNSGPCETPNLDRLAKEGTRLTRFYVHSVCSPTRAALLTGRYPFRNGMEERSHGNDIAGMLPDERTLAQALKPFGYDTALIGKWHLGNWYQRQLPLQRGSITITAFTEPWYHITARPVTSGMTGTATVKPSVRTATPRIFWPASSSD